MTKTKYHALTMWRPLSPCYVLLVPGMVFPSTQICFFILWLIDSLQDEKSSLKCLWTKAAKKREIVSWEGMQLGKSKKLANQSSLDFPNYSMATQLSAPHIMAHKLIATMFKQSCFCVLDTRGSGKSSKCWWILVLNDIFIFAKKSSSSIIRWFVKKF